MFHQNPHGYLENLKLAGVISYTWNDRVVLSDDDSISYQLQRVYTVFVANKVLVATYTQPRRLSAFSVKLNKLVHPSLARQSHRQIIAGLLNQTLDALPKVEVSNVK